MTTGTKRTELPERYEAGFLQGMDRRTGLYQRLNAVYETIIEDVGGDADISHAKLALIERFVFLEAVIQTWEQEIAISPKENEHLLSRWIQAVNSLQGLARAFGLERVAKRAANLKDYIEENGK